MKRSLIVSAAAMAALVAAEVLAEAYLVSFGPSGMGDDAGASAAEVVYFVRELLIFLPLLLVPFAVVMVAVWGGLQMWRGQWSSARAALLHGGVLVVGATALVMAHGPLHALRRAGLSRAAGQMAPLVAAVARYEHEHGRPPERLSQLDGRYAGDTRRFGIRGCRPLSYTGGGAPGAWELHMECPRGWLELDSFFYRPGGRYRANEHNDRFGGWAYYWD